MNVTSLWAGGTVTPTAPLIEGTVAPSLILAREGGSGFDLNPAPAAGRYGCRITFPSALDFSSDYVGFGAGFQIFDTATNVATVASGGFRIVWVDGSGNYAGFNINGGSIPGYSSGNGEGYIQSFITRDGDLAPVWAIHKNRTPDILSGSISWSNITSVEISVLTTSAVRRDMYLRCVVRKAPILVTGTETFTTINTTAWAQGATVIDRQHFARLRRYLNGPVQSVFTSKLGLSIGDGSTTTNFTESNFSLGFTNTFDKSPAYATTGPFVQLDNSNTRQILINQSASCVLSLSDGTIGSAAWWQWVLQGSGTATLARVQFWRYNQFSAAHGTYTDCIWDGGEAAVGVVAATTITRGTVRNATAGGVAITGAAGSYATSLDATFANNATYDIAMGSGGAGTYVLTGVKVNSGYTLKLHNNSATNAITVEIAAGVATSTTTAGGSITISSPTLERGIAFTGLVAGTSIQVFTSGTQTKLFGDNSTAGSTFAFDDATAGTITVDYTIQRVGYFPQRVTGVALTGAVGGQLDAQVVQVADRAYSASSGLTYGTTAIATVGSNPATNPGTKTFQLTTPSTVQNWYSFWVEQWIDLGNATGEALANVAFPLSQNGPNSFTLGNGWAFSNGATSIAFLSRDGLRYTNSSGVLQKAWAAILTSGVPSGARVRYQQTDGGTTASAAVTSGNMDELIQIFDTGVFDYRGYLVLKVQEMGYDQAEANAVTLYGTLEDQLYVVGLVPSPNSVAVGDPALANPPTITDHGASPATWNSLPFSLTITDSAAGNSGTDIMRWLRYSFETGGSFQGKNAFDWHDLVQQNGDAFRTVRGVVYGDTGASLKGVRVVTNAGAQHPDFTAHTADSGTVFVPTFPSSASATVLTDTRVQLYNVTTSTELNNAFVTGTAYSFVVSSGVTVGDTVRLRACKKGRIAAEATAVWSSGGVTFLLSQPEDTIYTAWGIDGATVSEYSLDGINLQIDANDVDGFTQKVRLGAYYSYALTTEIGIRSFYGALTALAASSLRVNVDVVSMQIDNVNATTALVFTDVNVRLFRSDGSTIIAPTSYTIHNDYNGEPFTVETGVSGLTGSESAQLMAIPSASTNADAVRTELTTELGRIDLAISTRLATASYTAPPNAPEVADAVLTLAQITPIYSEVRRTNGQNIIGDGTKPNKFRSSLVG
jgi:hypothetical protein